MVMLIKMMMMMVRYLMYLLVLAENRQKMRGLAAELRGAKLWMKVATAMEVGVGGIRPNT